MLELSGSGNLVEDIDLRFSPQGRPFGRVRVAFNDRYKDKNGEWKDSTTFLAVVLNGTLAENAAKSLNKGDRVVVSGRLSQRNWETDEGQKRSALEMRANDIGPDLRWATAAVTKTPKGGGTSEVPNEAPAGQLPDEAPF